MGPRRHALLSLPVLAAMAACAGGPGKGLPSSPDGGGPQAQADDPATLACQKDADCGTGEMCIENVCQVGPCGGTSYASVAPLGRRALLGGDRELVAVSGSALEVYEPTDGAFAHVTTPRFGAGTRVLVDVAAGNVQGSGPESLVAAVAGSTKVGVMTGGVWSDIAVGFAPVAVAAGDLDGDGVDEVVAVSRDGDVAACKAGGACTRRAVDGVIAKGAAVADVDGDGAAEVVVLADAPDGRSVLVLFTKEIQTVTTGITLTRLAAANTDGEGPVELVALEDGGYLGLASDVVHIYGTAPSGAGESRAALVELGTYSAPTDTLDLQAGHLDADAKSEVLLRSPAGVHVLRARSRTALYEAQVSPLTGIGEVSRLVVADVDGDTPVVRLVKEAEPVAGPVVPVAVLTYPPYAGGASDGTSDVGVGSRESRTEGATSTVALKAAVGVGFEADFPGVAKASVSVRVEAQVARTLGETRTVAVGQRFNVSADTAGGAPHGVAILAGACYHAYTYALEDPGGRMGPGGQGRLLSLFVPVGGQTSLWSLGRYNAFAKARGTVPVIPTPFTAGDLASYPTTASRLDGSTIPAEDLLFTAPAPYRVSDVARVGWSFDASQSRSRTDAFTVGVSVKGSVKAGVVTLDGEVGASYGEAYTVTVGQESSIFGSVPAVPDDLSTAQDEHTKNAYAFTPVVYRERYTTQGGATGGYYVVTYAVSR